MRRILIAALCVLAAVASAEESGVIAAWDYGLYQKSPARFETAMDYLLGTTNTVDYGLVLEQRADRGTNVVLNITAGAMDDYYAEGWRDRLPVFRRMLTKLDAAARALTAEKPLTLEREVWKYKQLTNRVVRVVAVEIEVIR